MTLQICVVFEKRVTVDNKLSHVVKESIQVCPGNALACEKKKEKYKMQNETDFVADFVYGV